MPEEVFDKYNRPEAKIRIFGYAVGPTANPVAAVKWIACTNRGYFYRIPAMGAIRSTVQAFVAWLGNELAMSSVYYQEWNSVYYDNYDFYKYIGLGLTDDFIREPIVPNIYKDQWHYSNILGRSTALGAFSQSALWTNIQAPFHQNICFVVPDVLCCEEGMGMMTTVTLPVYNRTNDIANQTILGVMGCDVTVEEMSHFVDKRQLGPNGYDFAINSNGYIVFHPNLKATNGWLKNPPNVDFLEVEYETEAKVEMRMHMIDGETGSANIQTYVVLPDELHVDNASRTYYYTFVPDSTFSVGVVLPDYATKFIKSVKAFTDVAQGIELLRSLDTDLILADWDYCSELMPVADSNSSNWVEDVINTFEFGYHKCNQDLAQHLFLDAGIAEGMVSYWRDKAPEKIEAAFVATNAGLTKIFPAGTNSSFERLSDPWKAVYYKRSFDNDLWMFSADIVRAEENYTTIMASKAIEIEDAGYKPAVIGVLLSQATLIKQVTDQMKACKNLQTKCYLLDDGGFIMMSTNEEEDSKVIGKFFGETERDVMAHMINTSVFIQNEQYDYQGACQEVRKIASAGTTLISPIFYDMLSLNWWTAKFAWAYLNFNLYNWLFPVRNYVYADGEDEEMTELSNYSCILKLSQYHYNTQQEFSDSKGMITCSSCQKSYATSRIMSTNLLLVMVEGIEDCNRACTHNPLPLQPKESTDPNFSNDECIVTKRYRKRPPCYDYNEHENTSLCGSCSLLYPCPVLLLLASLCLVLIQRQNL
ncbi:hypothetical protein CAPTEDRAFT_221382 [Capitella teleta]|uniref:Voltage-dependent calcium channel alpha-2/delta subunit conserved region domain-containing protein n=1 Tax=Capitella teleta TaxID=283909 RepID=R7VAP5_CAPTE|nr:hypothetical protein CAPTEDRAFT_221382 [Capitella teleta]|eukprot:ELU15918.1 hypothetical protein CAPTEDRAFT_221382 [Capitella teleta]